MRSIVLPLILCIVLFNLFAGTQAQGGPVWKPRTEKFQVNTCTSAQCVHDFVERLGNSSWPNNCKCTPIDPTQYSCTCDVLTPV
ncbi:hypothetical protein Q3G72_021217 [Acer saccharum]|nr:hypothetical protein Q3G72_021217 [Acer saccharum]